MGAKQSYGGVAKKIEQFQIDRQVFAQAVLDLYHEQRMSAVVEEVVVGSDFPYAEYLGPERRYTQLHWLLGRERDRAWWWCIGFRIRKGLQIDLTMGCMR